MRWRDGFTWFGVDAGEGKVRLMFGSALFKRASPVAVRMHEWYSGILLSSSVRNLAREMMV